MELNLYDCPNCGTEGVLPTSDHRCPHCKEFLRSEAVKATKASDISSGRAADIESGAAHHSEKENAERAARAKPRPAPHYVTSKLRIPCKCGSIHTVITGIGGVIQGLFICGKCGGVITLEDDPLLQKLSELQSEDDAEQPIKKGGKCMVCQKTIEGHVMKVFAFAASDAATEGYVFPYGRHPETLTKKPRASQFVLGWICSSCGSIYCPQCAIDKMYSGWSNWKKSKCLSCDEPFVVEEGIVTAPGPYEVLLGAAVRDITCDACSESVRPWARKCKCGKQTLSRSTFLQRAKEAGGSLLVSLCVLVACFLVFVIGASLGSFDNPVIRWITLFASLAATLNLFWLGTMLWRAWTPWPWSKLLLRRGLARVEGHPEEAAEDLIRGLLFADIPVKKSGVLLNFGRDTIMEAHLEATRLCSRLEAVAMDNPRVQVGILLARTTIARCVS